METSAEQTPPTFEVEVHREPDGSYWVEVPGLPGLVTQGDTMQELEENLQEAFDGWMLAKDPKKRPTARQILDFELIQMFDESIVLVSHLMNEVKRLKKENNLLRQLLDKRFEAQ